MKSEHDREQLINAINVLLHQAYDSTLDEIHALLKRIEAEEDENDLRAYHAAKSDVENNSAITWDEIKQEIANERKKNESHYEVQRILSLPTYMGRSDI